MKLFEHPDFDQVVIRAADYCRPRVLREAIVEKDYYVTEALRIVAAAASDKVIFQGGTSLSKGWNLIQRFSEDIDLFLHHAEIVQITGKSYRFRHQAAKGKDPVEDSKPAQAPSGSERNRSGSKPANAPFGSSESAEDSKPAIAPPGSQEENQAALVAGKKENEIRYDWVVHLENGGSGRTPPNNRGRYHDRVVS